MTKTNVMLTPLVLIALAANAGEIATENSPTRITINKQPTTVSIWYVDKASSDIAFVKKILSGTAERHGINGSNRVLRSGRGDAM